MEVNSSVHRSQTTAKFLSFLALVMVKIHLAATGSSLNKISSSYGMSLESYTANYRPGMHTTALLFVNVNA